MTRLTMALGFLIPWRIEATVLGRETFVSPFDIVWPLAIFFIIPRGIDRVSLAALAIFAIVNALHLHVVGLAAIAAGVALTMIDREELFKGLRAGLIVSLLFYPLAPQAYFEGGYFAGLYGSKNGFAFLAAIIAIWKIRTPETFCWMVLVVLTESRTAALALAVAILVIRPFAALALLAVFAFLAGNLPHDRFEFAYEIARHADKIPFLGAGPDLNYGLDLYFKSLLNFGWIGAAALFTVIGRAMYQKRADPFLVFLLVFGLAHDPLRWPLFWMLLIF